MLVVALGNPGSKYAETKHNIAWMVVDQLIRSENLGNTTWKKKFNGEYLATEIGSKKVYFLKPQTFMNLSGECVQPMMKFFKIDIKDILVVHDELDHEFGTISFKDGGGLAGHNGLKSIAERLSSRDFKRLRVGIGRPKYGDVSSWVLSNFEAEQNVALSHFIDGTARGLLDYIVNDFKYVINKYNKKTLI